MVHRLLWDNSGETIVHILVQHYRSVPKIVTHIVELLFRVPFFAFMSSPCRNWNVAYPHFYLSRHSAHSQTNNLVMKSFLRFRWNCSFGGQKFLTWNPLSTKPYRSFSLTLHLTIFPSFHQKNIENFSVSKIERKKWNSRGLVCSCLKSVWFGGDPYFFMWNTNDWSHCTIDPERDGTVFNAKNLTKYWRGRRSLNFQSIVQCFTFPSLN